MKINEHLDTGPVLETYKIKINLNLNATELEKKLSQLAAEKIFLFWRGKKSTSGVFFLFQVKVFRVLVHFVN